MPRDYLLWALDNCENLPPGVRVAIEHHLNPPLRSESPAIPLNWEAILRDWHHKMKLEFHPELGGSDEQMRVVDAGNVLFAELIHRAQHAEVR